MLHTSDSEPTLFDLATIPLPHNQVTTLSLPSDDAASLLPDINYFTVTDVGTTTSWDESNLAIQVLDNFEKNFGCYVYPQ
jgi:hypothetical protein